MDGWRAGEGACLADGAVAHMCARGLVVVVVGMCVWGESAWQMVLCMRPSPTSKPHTHQHRCVCGRGRCCCVYVHAQRVVHAHTRTSTVQPLLVNERGRAWQTVPLCTCALVAWWWWWWVCVCVGSAWQMVPLCMRSSRQSTRTRRPTKAAPVSLHPDCRRARRRRGVAGRQCGGRGRAGRIPFW